ncbi:FAD-binding oxidoreductase [Streptomyces sp. SID11385]|nr:FAD-binding oxidoreductase [Streptomyces sp. SID11385]
MVSVSSPPIDTLVLGAGVVGASLAHQLGVLGLGAGVTVVDRRPPGRHPGSSGHAPGFVGQLSRTPELALLARESVRQYVGFGESVFRQVGGLSLATDPTQLGQLAQDA